MNKLLVGFVFFLSIFRAASAMEFFARFVPAVRVLANSITSRVGPSRLTRLVLARNVSSAFAPQGERICSRVRSLRWQKTVPVGVRAAGARWWGAALGLAAGAGVVGAKCYGFRSPEQQEALDHELWRVTFAGGSVEEIKKVVQRGAQINTSLHATTPLHNAAQLSDVAAVRFLLNKGARVNAKDAQNGDTPLHCAVRCGAVEVVRALLHYDADIDAENIYGQTPFDLAKQYGNEEVLRLIRTCKTWRWAARHPRVSRIAAWLFIK